MRDVVSHQQGHAQVKSESIVDSHCGFHLLFRLKIESLHLFLYWNMYKKDYNLSKYLDLQQKWGLHAYRRVGSTRFLWILFVWRLRMIFCPLLTRSMPDHCRRCDPWLKLDNGSWSLGVATKDLEPIWGLDLGEDESLDLNLNKRDEKGGSRPIKDVVFEITKPRLWEGDDNRQRALFGMDNWPPKLREIPPPPHHTSEK